MARGLAAAGARVAILGRREAVARAVAEEIVAAGNEAIPLPADVLDEDSLQTARKTLIDEWGTVDVLINSAGGNLRSAGESAIETLSPTLEPQGSVGGAGSASYAFFDWGYWAREGDETLFRAFIRGTPENGASYTLHVEGTPSGTNPVGGSAVWSGGVRAFDTHPDTLGTPVSGDARIEVDFAATTLDVAFTNFTGGHGDMAWRDLSIENGTFRHERGPDTLDGAFYGDDHRGAAGSFERDRLRGVFGTLREPKP